MRRLVLAIALTLAATPAFADGFLDTVTAPQGYQQQGYAQGSYGYTAPMADPFATDQSRAQSLGYVNMADFADDTTYLRQAEAQALAGRVGQPATWQNPRTGNRGAIQVVADGRDDHGHLCRRLTQAVAINGQSRQASGVVCNVNGSWKDVQ